jgi:hypothetical protein
VYGALAGLVAGGLAGYAVAVVVLQARRWRNAWLFARGGVGYKDCILPHLWVPGAVQGAVVGGVAGSLTGAWHDGALASLALPVVPLVVGVMTAVRQCRGPFV